MANRSASFQGRDHFPAGFRILQGKQEFITYTDHSSVRLWASNTANHYDTHAHSAVEVIMPSEGTSVYQLTDETYPVKPGQILFVPSGCPHALTEGGDTSRYLLLFEPAPLLALQDMADISLMLQKPIYLRDDTEDRQKVHRYLMELVDCYKQQQPMWNTQCYSYILQCYALMGRSFLHTTTPAAAQSHWRIDPEIMNSAMTFINEHYMEDISLEGRAEKVYRIPVRGVMGDKFNPFQLLTLYKNADFSQFTVDASAHAGVFGPVGKDISIKDLSLEKLLEKAGQK